MVARILAAVDFSEQSTTALRAAFARAREAGATLRVCHVIPAFRDVSVLFPQNHQEATLRFVRAEEQALTALSAHVDAVLGPEGNVELMLGVGVHYEEIIAAAEAWQAELIVVGSGARHGLAGTLLGSVAERVVRYASCPVLVHRASEGRTGVLAATDLSDASLPSVAAGAREARRRAQPLTIVHAMDLAMPALSIALGTPFGATGTLPSVEQQQLMRDLLLASLTEAVHRSGAEGTARVIDGEPARAILDCAEEIKADLIVVGTRGRTGFSRLTLGSVAEQVVHRATVSVLAVRLTEGARA